MQALLERDGAGRLPKKLQKRLKQRALELGVPTSSLMSAILAENT